MTQRLSFDKTVMQPVTSYSSRLALAIRLGSGSGESHTYAVHIEPGGEIGEHETGFGQLFIVIDGSGWVQSGADRHEVTAGEAFFLPRGVQHSKGSKAGMTALMVQAFDLEPLGAM